MANVRRFPLVLLAAATAAALPATAAKINVNDTVRDAINKDQYARVQVFRAIGVANPLDPAWHLKSVKISKLKAGARTIQMPPSAYEFVTSQEILNCAPTGIRTNVTLTDTVTNSVTVTKSDTLEVGAEVAVSAEYMGVSASLTGRTNYSVSNERADSTEKALTLSQTVEVTYNDKGGRIAVLEADKLQATSIPWTATFTPDDDDDVQFTAGPVTDGLACFYEHKDYTGFSTCWGAGKEMKSLGKMNDMITSVKIIGAVKVILYQHPNFEGKEHGMLANDPLLGGGWNDIVSSIKVVALRNSANLKFGAIKASLPQAARVFTVGGTMSVSQTKFDAQRVTSYEMTDEEVTARCSNRPVRSGTAGPSPAAAPDRGKLTPANVEVRTLSRDEFRKAIVKARRIGK